MAACPTCNREAHPIIEMAVPTMPDGKTTQPHAAPRPTRICSLCRAPWSEQPVASTAPAAPMPAPASPSPSAPVAAPPKANGNGVRRQIAPPTDHRIAAQPGPAFVPAAPDYEALMRAELDALDAAEKHIAARRAYLHDLLGRLAAANSAHPVAAAVN